LSAYTGNGVSKYDSVDPLLLALFFTSYARIYGLSYGNWPQSIKVAMQLLASTVPTDWKYMLCCLHWWYALEFVKSTEST